MCSVKETTAQNHIALDSLIPVLQQVQTQEGFLSVASMEEISQLVGVPVSRVFGVATFYRQFRFAPLGKHIIQLCRGTACHVRGSLLLANHLKRRLKLKSDGNSPDGKFSVVTVACLGACALAPVIKLDSDFYGHLTIQKLDQLIDEVGGTK